MVKVLRKLNQGLRNLRACVRVCEWGGGGGHRNIGEMITEGTPGNLHLQERSKP